MNTQDLARRIRADVLKMCHDAPASHIGSNLSCADILAVLYGSVMEEGDRFILSKGHAAAALYATLFETGRLASIDGFGTTLPTEASHLIDGVEFSTGSLGHGMSLGCGLALADRSRRVFVLVGDGELDEGACWEAAAFAAANKLGNLHVIVDRNGLQAYGRDVLKKNIAGMFGAARWTVYGCMGHDHGAIQQRLSWPHSGPTCIIALTTKGKGVSFMEDKLEWHYKSPDDDELARALAEVPGDD